MECERGGARGRPARAVHFGLGRMWARIVGISFRVTMSASGPRIIFPRSPMPRSPIRRPANGLALARWLRRPDDLPPILSSGELFGNDLPLQLEIGSGKGLFLSNAAAADPRRNFVGIEIAAKYAAHAAARLAKRDATNALVIAGDAGPLVRDRVATASVDAVHVYFPDPWWKKKHRRRRVLNSQTVPEIHRVLRPGGHFHFWTDVLEYFEATIELVADICPGLGVPFPEPETDPTHDLDYRTHFERRSRREGTPVYRVRYEKRSAPSRLGL